MVNAESVITGYRCEKCQKIYSYRDDANDCCKKKRFNLKNNEI